MDLNMPCQTPELLLEPLRIPSISVLACAVFEHARAMKAGLTIKTPENPRKPKTVESVIWTLHLNNDLCTQFSESAQGFSL
jgi:hypothetical protein